ncbi:MAG: phosphate ABC transporter substrate-binding protein PstS [Pseudomonadota bacterium]
MLLPALAVGICLSIVSARASWSQDSGPAAAQILTGAGATFPALLYREWIRAFQNETGIRIAYEETGSGKGIQKLLSRDVDFGATDAFLNDSETAVSGNRILHFPTCVGAVAVIYHLPGDPGIDMTPSVLADIFLGKIRRWNAPSIRAINTDAALPDQTVNVIHRSDSSGTTFLFTDFLTKTSDAWREQVGSGKKIAWPVGMGVDGNGNVAAMVKKIPGSIGYVSMTYALQNRIPMAAIQNRSGRYVAPSVESVSLAAQVSLPADARLMITDTPAAGGYPISAFTYLIVFAEQSYANRSETRAQALADLLNWTLTKGQSFNAGLHYAPLPAGAVETITRQLLRLTWNGAPLWPR